MVDDVSTVAPRGCINDRPFIFSRVDKTGFMFSAAGIQGYTTCWCGGEVLGYMRLNTVHVEVKNCLTSSYLHLQIRSTLALMSTY